MDSKRVLALTVVLRSISLEFWPSDQILLKYPKKSLSFAPSQGKKGVRIEYLVDGI